MSLPFFCSRVISSSLLLSTYHIPKKSLSSAILTHFQNFSTSLVKMSSSRTFQEACEKAKNLKQDPGNDVKLNMYSLFKQATEGACKQSKPSVFDLVGKAKWEAWNSLGTMPQEEAKKKYMELVDKLAASDQQVEETSHQNQSKKYEGITVTVGKYITEIKLNRPNKKNAITTQMYKDMILILKEASENDTVVTVLTGEGDYFCSGNDLSNFTKVEGDIPTAAQNAARMLNDFVGAFIDFPKILVAAVNGPAIGLAVTLLGLCDAVYASDKATFITPFSSLGQTPEGCSTYTFPKIMGYSKATEILLFGKKMTASEAMACGLVSEVFPHNTFSEHVQNKLSFLPEASKQSMMFSKELIRKKEKELLHAINDEECQRLVERWQSDDCMEAIMKFFQRKSKL